MPKLRSNLLLSCSVIALGAALSFPGVAYAQCVPAEPAPVALSTGACTDTGVSRTSVATNVPVIDVSGGIYTGNSVTLTTANDFINGATASGSGHIDLSDSNISTTGTYSYGLQATGGGTSAGQGLVITTTGFGSSGVVAKANSSVTLTNTDVSTVEGRSSALWAISGTIIGTDLTIRTEGADGQAHGVVAEAGGTIDLARASITITGASAEGVYAYTGGNITGTDLTINIEGETADGAAAFDGGEVHLTGGSIVIAGQYAGAVYAYLNSRITAANVQLNALGDNSNGAVAAAGSTVTLSGGSITTSGAIGHGIYTFDAGTVNADSVALTTSGDGADGARSEDVGSSVTLIGGTIATSGASANGVSAREGGTLTATNTAVAVTGLSAAAVQVMGGTAADRSIVTVTGGSLTSSQGPLVLSGGGVGVVSLNGPIAITSGIVGGQPALAIVTAGTGGVPPSNLTFDLNGLGDVFGTFRVTDADNTSNTTFNATNWTGDLIAEAGNTPNTNLLSSRWTGFATNAANIDVDGASAWNVTGSSNATGTLSNAGLVQFVPLSSGFSTLTTGSYVGQSGQMAFNTYLGADGSPTNLLVLNGGTASGTTALSVTNAGGGGELTAGDGIRLVQAVNGGSTQPGAFTLAGRAAAGAYEYLLFRGGSSGAEDWFLRSTLVAVDPPVPESVIPLYRPEVPLYAPIPAMARHMGLATLGTLHERVGEEMNIQNRTDSGTFGNGSWARLIGETGNSRWSGTVDANAHDANLGGIQAGFDVYRSLHDNGHRDHIGLYIAEISYRSSISGFALGQQNLQVGQLTMSGPAAGAYWTHFGPSGWYLDAVIQGNWFDTTASSLYGAGMSTRGTGFTASLEAGYPIHLSQRWLIEPQGQIIYQNVSIGGSRDAYSTVAWNGGDAVTGRLGGRLQYTAHDGETLWQPYLKANLWHGFSGTDRTNFGASPTIESRFGTTSLEVGAGMTARITQVTSLYGHIDHRWSVDGGERRAATQGAVGVRFNW